MSAGTPDIVTNPQLYEELGKLRAEMAEQATTIYAEVRQFRHETPTWREVKWFAIACLALGQALDRVDVIPQTASGVLRAVGIF